MIIQSLLDTDLYKFTMQQVVMHQFPHAHDVEFHFKCRTVGVDLTPFISEINEEIDHLCSLRFTEEEISYLRTLHYLKSDYIDFLEMFQLKKRFVEVKKVSLTEIDIVIRGPWVHTILFEVPVLAIVNEVYFRNMCKDGMPNAWREGMNRLIQKVSIIETLPQKNEFHFSDFGTRRRFSYKWHEKVVETLKNTHPINFTGTSNVYFARKYKLTPIGTMAHEYLQACQALGPRLRDSQKFAFQKWVDEYRGDLGIALTDVVGMDAFLQDFDSYFCKLFDGVRHDSGDPFEWAEKMLAHYRRNKINPKDKSFVFSDSLDFDKASKLFMEYKDQAKVFFGIGTNLTNDVGLKPINIVIKMTECNGSPVAKLSDSPGKTMCKNDAYLAYLKQIFSKE